MKRYRFPWQGFITPCWVEVATTGRVVKSSVPNWVGLYFPKAWGQVDINKVPDLVEVPLLEPEVSS
jgi:hypothetical protein